jgi:hypothetical protein
LGEGIDGAGYFVTDQRDETRTASMGRPPIGREKMSGAERTRRYRAKLRAAHAQPEATGCSWCGRSGCILVGENAVVICERCVAEAGVAIAEARAAKKRAAVVSALRDEGDPLA